MLREDPALADPLPGAEDYLAVEARYAVTHEGARHLDDVLARRTRISIEAWDRGVAAAPTVAALMANVLGWDNEQKDREIDRTWYEWRPSVTHRPSRTMTQLRRPGWRRRTSRRCDRTRTPCPVSITDIQWVT